MIAVMQSIPIEAAPFTCPQCGERKHLKYNVTTTCDDEGPAPPEQQRCFSFAMNIECTRCTRKRSIVTVVASSPDVIKIEIKPTGIVVQKDNPTTNATKDR